MKAEQLSIFLENIPGRLAEVIGLLARNNIDIRALSLADTIDFGMLRIITDHPAEARRILTENGFSAQVTEVLAVEVPDKPGGLSRVLDAFTRAGANVEYMYAFVNKPGQGAVMIFRLDDIEKGAAALSPESGRIVPTCDIYGK